jgi:hypothetical protein
MFRSDITLVVGEERLGHFIMAKHRKIKLQIFGKKLNNLNNFPAIQLIGLFYAGVAKSLTGCSVRNGTAIKGSDFIERGRILLKGNSSQL